MSNKKNASARGNNERKTLEAWAYHFKKNPQDLKPESRSKKASAPKYNAESRTADVAKSLNLTGRTSQAFAKEQALRGGILANGRGQSVLMLKPEEMRANPMTVGAAGVQTTGALDNGAAPIYQGNLNFTRLFPIGSYFDAANVSEVTLPNMLGIINGTALNELDAVNTTEFVLDDAITVTPQRIVNAMSYSKQLTLQSAELQDSFFMDAMLKGLQNSADQYITREAESAAAQADMTGVTVEGFMTELVSERFFNLPEVHVAQDVYRMMMSANADLFEAIERKGVKVIRNPYVSAGKAVAMEPGAMFVAQWGDNARMILDPYTGSAQDVRKVTGDIQIGCALRGEATTFHSISDGSTIAASTAGQGGQNPGGN